MARSQRTTQTKSKMEKGGFYDFNVPFKAFEVLGKVM
jgi:hypothetical protein